MKKSELKAIIREVVEELNGTSETFPVFIVHVPANVYAGKYYDYQTFSVPVRASDEIKTEQDAIRWVNNNKQKVLDAANKSRLIGGRRRVPTPVEKNVFFKNTYHVKKSEVTTNK